MEEKQNNNTFKPNTSKRVFTVGLFVLSILTAFVLGLYRMPPSATYDNTVFNEVFYRLHQDHYTQPSESQLWEGAIQGMIDSLDDPFTIYRDAEAYARYQESQQENFVGIGVTVLNADEAVVVTSTFPGSPAEEAGLMNGDIITHVDGVDYTNKSFDETIGVIAGEVGTTLELGYYRPGLDETIFVTLTRREIDRPSVVGRWLDDEVVLIEIRSFNENTADLFIDMLEDFEAEGLQGLLIDVRNNGGGFLTTLVDILDVFLVRDDTPLFTREIWQSRSKFEAAEYGDGENTKPYPIAVIVNAFSASASEVFAAAMHEKGGYDVFGVTTYGKGTHQTGRPLQSVSDHFLTITTGIWLTSNGNWIDRASETPGFEPSIIVEEGEAFQIPLLYVKADEVYEHDMVDEKIALMQTILNLIGANVRNDGYFDNDTETALRAFQVDQQLSNTGVLNQVTANALSQWLLAYREDPVNDDQLQAALQYIKDSIND